MANFAKLFEAIVKSKFEGESLESIVVGGRRIPCVRLADNKKLELVIVAKTGSAPGGFNAYHVSGSEADSLDTYYDKANEAGITVTMTATARLQAIQRANLKRAERQELEIELNSHYTDYLTEHFDKVADIDNVLQCQGAFVGLANTAAQLSWLLKGESENVVQIAYLTQKRKLIRDDKKRGKDSKAYKEVNEQLKKVRTPLVDRRQKAFPKDADTTPAS